MGRRGERDPVRSDTGMTPLFPYSQPDGLNFIYGLNCIPAKNQGKKCIIPPRGVNQQYPTGFPQD